MPNSGMHGPGQFNRHRPRRRAQQIQQQLSGAPQIQPGVPPIPPAPPNFLAPTPGFEASRRVANDTLMGAQNTYNHGVGLVNPQLQLMLSRLNTDRGYATQHVNEDFANRGLYDSGLRAQALEQQVAIPYGRQMQDLGLGAGQQYGSLASGLGAARLGYDQSTGEALIQRALDAAQQMSLSTPQFGYDLPSAVPGGAPQQQQRQRRHRRHRRNR